MRPGLSGIRPVLGSVIGLLLVGCLSCCASRPACECTSVVKAEASPAVPPIQVVHEVGPGDTLAWIARSYGVSLESLARSNGVENVDQFTVGQRVRLPDDARLLRFVHIGDTLSSIAALHGVSVSAIIEENSLEAESLTAGEILRLPPDAKLLPDPLTRAGSLHPARATGASRGWTKGDPSGDVDRKDSQHENRARIERLLAGAEALLLLAEESYFEARFDDAYARSREARSLLSDSGSSRSLRARAAFIEGSSLAGLGRDEEAVVSFERVHSIDPTFEPPATWSSPKIERLYRSAIAS